MPLLINRSACASDTPSLIASARKAACESTDIRPRHMRCEGFCQSNAGTHHVALFDGPKLPSWWHDGPKLPAAYLRNILPGFAARCASRSGRRDVRHDGPDIPAAYPQTMSGRRRRPSPSVGSSHTSLPTRMLRGPAEQ